MAKLPVCKGKVAVRAFEKYGWSLARYIDGPAILFFGFIREYKGLKYLIKALPEVLSKINVTLRGS